MLSNKISEFHCAWILSSFSLRARISLTTWLVFSAFQLSIPIFFITFQMWFRLPHLSIAGILRCMCTLPIDTMGIYLIHCAHNNEHTRTQDAICSTFVTIVRNAIFYMRQEQLQVLPSTMFNSSCWRVDIVFTKDDIHTLVDIVIADSTQANLFSWSCATQRFVAFNVVQAKKKELSWPTPH